MSQLRLLPMIRARLKELLHGYVDRPQVLDRLDEFIVAPALGAQAGVLGALALGLDAANQHVQALSGAT